MDSKTVRKLEANVEEAIGDAIVVMDGQTGKMFVEVEIGDVDADDFADEIARTRNNPELRQLRAERSLEPCVLSMDEVRQRAAKAYPADRHRRSTARRRAF